MVIWCEGAGGEELFHGLLVSGREKCTHSAAGQLTLCLLEFGKFESDHFERLGCKCKCTQGPCGVMTYQTCTNPYVSGSLGIG